MSEAALAYGSGSGAAHLVTGHGVEHAALEEELAEFTGRERALLFSTGYMANLAAISALADRGDVVLLDRLNHASLIDGARLSGARFSRYAHGDAAAAEQRARRAQRTTHPCSRPTACSAWTATSRRCPTLARACRAHQAWLVVDDAHGFGVLGPRGRGTLEHFGLGAEDVPVLVGTLGKALRHLRRVRRRLERT